MVSYPNTHHHRSSLLQFSEVSAIGCCRSIPPCCWCLYSTPYCKNQVTDHPKEPTREIWCGKWPKRGLSLRAEMKKSCVIQGWWDGLVTARHGHSLVWPQPEIATTMEPIGNICERTSSEIHHLKHPEIPLQNVHTPRIETVCVVFSRGKLQANTGKTTLFKQSPSYLGLGTAFQAAWTLTVWLIFLQRHADGVCIQKHHIFKIYHHNLCICFILRASQLMNLCERHGSSVMQTFTKHCSIILKSKDTVFA